MALRLASARVSVAVGGAQRLETNLLQGVGEEPAFELDAGFGGALARLQFVEGGFHAVDEGFVVDDRGVEGCDEFEEIGLAFEEVGEAIRVVRCQGAELIEERLLGLQLLAERAAWVTGHKRRGIDVSSSIANPTAGPGYFLAGDAASIVDPLSSHGILKALMSGMKAAHHSATVLR
jgi:hypothetical protein